MKAKEFYQIGSEQRLLANSNNQIQSIKYFSKFYLLNSTKHACVRYFATSVPLRGIIQLRTTQSQIFNCTPQYVNTLTQF